MKIKVLEDFVRHGVLRTYDKFHITRRREGVELYVSLYDGTNWKAALPSGTNDDIDVRIDSKNLFVLSRNRGIPYIGMSIFIRKNGEYLGEIFLQESEVFNAGIKNHTGATRCVNILCDIIRIHS